MHARCTQVQYGLPKCLPLRGLPSAWPLLGEQRPCDPRADASLPAYLPISFEMAMQSLKGMATD